MRNEMPMYLWRDERLPDPRLRFSEPRALASGAAGEERGARKADRMAIETLDDIVEALADGLGIYGACGHGTVEDDQCRPCFVANLKQHIRDAVEVEQKLAEPAASKV